MSWSPAMRVTRARALFGFSRLPSMRKRIDLANQSSKTWPAIAALSSRCWATDIQLVPADLAQHARAISSVIRPSAVGGVRHSQN